MGHQLNATPCRSDLQATSRYPNSTHRPVSARHGTVPAVPRPPRPLSFNPRALSTPGLCAPAHMLTRSSFTTVPCCTSSPYATQGPCPHGCSQSHTNCVVQASCTTSTPNHGRNAIPIPVLAMPSRTARHCTGHVLPPHKPDRAVLCRQRPLAVI